MINIPQIPKPKKLAHMLTKTMTQLTTSSGVMGTDSNIAGRVQALKMGSDIDVLTE